MNSEFSLLDSEPVIREVTESGGEIRIFPKGTSMLPLLRQGRDSVVLVKAEGELSRGDIPLYKRDDGSYVLHRIVKVEQDGTYTMCGDNQTTLETGIRPEQIIATVSAIYRKDKRVEKSALSYRLYVFLWRSFFIRKVYFKARGLALRLRKKK